MILRLSIFTSTDFDLYKNGVFLSGSLSLTYYACRTRHPKPRPQALSLYSPRKPLTEPVNITGQWCDGPFIDRAEPVDGDRSCYACRNSYVGHFDAYNLSSAKEREISGNARRHYRSIEKLKASADGGCHLCSLLASSIQQKPEFSQKREIKIVYGVDAGIRFGYVQIHFYSLGGEHDAEMKECFSIEGGPRRIRFCAIIAVLSGLD